MIDSKLPPSFWPYSIKRSVFIKNRSPHSSINSKILFQEFFNRPVDFNKIKLFGSKVFYVIDKPNHKFDERARPAIYLCVDEESSGHILFDPILNKTISMFHIRFSNQFYYNDKS